MRRASPCRALLCRHRRLFRHFTEIKAGMALGPAGALAWSFEYFVLSFFRGRRARKYARAAAKVAKPSGKLWIAMARAVSMPVRSSRESAAGAANAASGSASPG